MNLQSGAQHAARVAAARPDVSDSDVTVRGLSEDPRTQSDSVGLRSPRLGSRNPVQNGASQACHGAPWLAARTDPAMAARHTFGSMAEFSDAIDGAGGRGQTSSTLLPVRDQNSDGPDRSSRGALSAACAKTLSTEPLTQNEATIFVCSHVVVFGLLLAAGATLAAQAVDAANHPLQRVSYEQLRETPEIDFVAIVFNALTVDNCNRQGARSFCSSECTYCNVSDPKFDFSFAVRQKDQYYQTDGPVGTVIRSRRRLNWMYDLGSSCQCPGYRGDICPAQTMHGQPCSKGNFSVAWTKFPFPFVQTAPAPATEIVRGVVRLRDESSFNCIAPWAMYEGPEGPAKWERCTDQGSKDSAVGQWANMRALKHSNSSGIWPFTAGNENPFGWPDETFFLIAHVKHSDVASGSVGLNDEDALETKVDAVVTKIRNLASDVGDTTVTMFEVVSSIRPLLELTFPEGAFVNPADSTMHHEQTIRVRLSKDTCSSNFLEDALNTLFDIRRPVCADDHRRETCKAAVDVSTSPSLPGALNIRDIQGTGPGVIVESAITIKTTIVTTTWLNVLSQMLALCSASLGLISYLFRVQGLPPTFKFGHMRANYERAVLALTEESDGNEESSRQADRATREPARETS